MTFGDLVVVTGDGDLRGRVGSVTRVSPDQVWIEVEGRDAPEAVAAHQVVLAETFFQPAAVTAVAGAGDADLRRRAADETRRLLSGWPDGWVV